MSLPNNKWCRLLRLFHLMPRDQFLSVNLNNKVFEDLSGRI